MWESKIFAIKNKINKISVKREIYNYSLTASNFKIPLMMLIPARAFPCAAVTSTFYCAPHILFQKFQVHVRKFSFHGELFHPFCP